MKPFFRWLVWGWLACLCAPAIQAAVTMNCGVGTAPMQFEGSYAYSGPLHQAKITPVLAQQEWFVCQRKLSLEPTPKIVQTYVESAMGLSWATLNGRDYIDLGNGLGLFLEVADEGVSVYQGLLRNGQRVSLYDGRPWPALGLWYRLSLMQIGVLRPGRVQRTVAKFTVKAMTGQSASADIVVNFNLTQGPMLSCSMAPREFMVQLQPVTRQALLSQQGREILGGQLTIGGLVCPSAGVQVRAVLSDNQSEAVKNWLTAFNANGSRSGVGFRFKDATTGQVIRFGPETTLPQQLHQFDFKLGRTVANEVLSKTFDVYYVNALNGQPIEAGLLKGYGKITFSYQ